MSKEAMKLAIEALYLAVRMEPSDSIHECPEMFQGAITALRNELAKQEQGEPVAWSVTRYGIHCNNVFSNNTLAEIELNRLDEKYGKEGRTLVPLYTTPQQRKPLTMFDTEKLAKQCGVEWTTRIDKLCKLAAAHGIKE